MFKHLSLLSLLLALIVPSNALAAKAGHVRHVEPTAEKSKGSCADDATWKVVTLGSVDPKTCFKTSDGGGVELQLNGDNSSIKIAENSVVFLNSMQTVSTSLSLISRRDILVSMSKRINTIRWTSVRGRLRLQSVVRMALSVVTPFRSWLAWNPVN